MFDEQDEFALLLGLVLRMRQIPSGTVFTVLQHYAYALHLIADCIRAVKVISLACLGTSVNEELDQARLPIGIDVARGIFR